MPTREEKIAFIKNQMASANPEPSRAEKIAFIQSKMAAPVQADSNMDEPPGAIRQGLQSFFENHPTVATVASGVGRTLDYPGGLLRTGLASTAGLLQGKTNVVNDEDVLNAFKGKAPSSSEYLKRMGLDEGFELLNNPITGKISLRDAEGLGLDVLTDPFTLASKLTKTGSTLDKAANPMSRATESVGAKVYKSGFKDADLAAARTGAKPVSELALRQGVTGSAQQVFEQLTGLGKSLLEGRDKILNEATKAGGEVDMKRAAQEAQAFVDHLRKMDNPELGPAIGLFQKRINKYLDRAAVEPEKKFIELPYTREELVAEKQPSQLAYVAENEKTAVSKDIPVQPSAQDGFQKVNPHQFIAVRDQSKRSQFLSPTPAEELTGHELHVNKNGVGYALSPEKDLQGVFNNSGKRGAGTEAVIHAITNNAKTLDAFDGFLPDYYSKFGFREVKRLPFNDQYAPKGWDYAKQGRPDVVFMEYPNSLSREEGAIRARLEDHGNFDQRSSESGPAVDSTFRAGNRAAGQAARTQVGTGSSGASAAKSASGRSTSLESAGTSGRTTELFNQNDLPKKYTQRLKDKGLTESVPVTEESAKYVKPGSGNVVFPSGDRFSEDSLLDLPGGTKLVKRIVPKTEVGLVESERIAGPTPVQASSWKTTAANSVGESGYDLLARSKEGYSFDKKLAGGLRAATEESVGRTLGVEQQKALNQFNQDLRSILATDSKARIALEKEARKNGFTSVDGMLITHPGIFATKKTADILKGTWARTKIGHALNRLGKTGVLDDLARRTLIDEAPEDKKKSQVELDAPMMLLKDDMKSSDKTVNEPEPLRGKAKWSNDGFNKILEHTDDPKEKQMFEENKGALLDDPKIKDLLIVASDLKPGSRAMDKIMSKIQDRMAKEKN